ncbi:hypothetical protein KAW48_01010 [candidate division WOR-3 bacterium]|nr:hypothetical protein [candidate division WOR-3 bacterium]
MFNKVLLSIIIFSIVFAQGAKASLKYDYDIHGGEKYIIKEVAFIPWGEEDSLLGFIPSVAEVNEKGDTGMIHPGYGVRSWDVGKDGKIYVADEVKIRVLVYDSNGHYLRSIGIWDLDTNKIYVKATSGEEKVISPFQPEKYNKEERRFYPFTYKTYFDYPSDVAVDGMGNVYVIPSLSASCVYKFSPEGKLLEIIDKFGEYGHEEIRDIFLYSPKNPYGNIIVTLNTKSKGPVNIMLDEKGNITYKGGKPPRQDAKGNVYKVLKTEKKRFEPESEKLIGIESRRKSKEDTISIHFDPPSNATFFGVDGDGNLYFDVGWALHKYDQKGNLLAIIQGKPDTTRTFKNAMPGMAAVSKVMANGDIYDAYMCDQGFVVYKHELQQETKGQILKPAVKPEKN